MRVGTLEIEIAIPTAESLKDKRQVIRHLLESIRHRHNVSAAEVGLNEQWKRALLGFAAVSNDGGYLNGLLDTVERAIDDELRCEVVAVERDIA